MRKSVFSGAIAGLCLIGMTNFAGAAPIDLSGWTAEGGGNWIVSPNGSQVTQTRNGNPTYFLSDTDYINTEFNGSFSVSPNWGDDDFIGFVFGWQNSDDYYLFDWKKNNQGFANEGYTLSHITGADVDYWDHTGSDITVLGTSYSNSSGWEHGIVYNFTLNYTTTGFTIDIDGTEIFNQTGNFNTGKFGFYNYSQAGVTYQGFDQAPTPNPVPEPTTMALVGAGLLLGASGIRRCRK